VLPFDRVVAATPPNSAPPGAESRPRTVLTGVFRRIANEPTPPAPPVVVVAPAPQPPPRAITHNPQLLGFAEPVLRVPPIEDFLPRDQAVAVPAAAAPVAVTVPDRVPEPPPAPPPIRARVRDLPPGPAAPSPAPPPSDRRLSFVGRLSRQLGEAVAAPTRVDPAPTRFDPLPEQVMPAPAPPRPAASAPKPVAPAPKPVAPAPGLVAAAPEPVAPEPVVASPPPPEERGGRESMPPNRRLYRRAKLSAEFEISGVPCTLIDVSIGGFAATGVPQVEPNTLVPVTLRLVIDGIEVGTQLQARIIYVTQGRSSGRFVDLSASQMAFLRYIVTWRGESIGAVGMTTLLDAIAGGPERGFGSGDRSDDDASKSRWWAGLIGRKINPPR